MAHLTVRPGVVRTTVGTALVLGTLATALCIPHARADTVAYLVNVTARPGYNFAGAENALAHGHQICDEVRAGRTYAQIVGHVTTDLHTTDEYQASYLISQAVNELCPASIWQLRNTAAQTGAGR